ncbi:MAG: helix-turn-helix domain-containing protein [Trebonia sp.]
MISPYVRRFRLSAELRALRAEHGNITQAQLAKLVGKHRIDITRLEGDHKFDQAVVVAILNALDVEADRWTRILTIAAEASQEGWWAGMKHMGDRQVLYANLEAGAASIRAYEQTFMPGLLQIPEYLQARAAAVAAIEPQTTATVDGMLAGRVARQRMVRRPGGPSLEVIVDEFAIRRPAVPPGVMRKQLQHMAALMEGGEQNVSLRVLPVHARIKDFMVPRCSYSIYTYPDPGDPRLLAIDTVTRDLTFTDEAHVSPYEKLFDNLREVAWSPAESAKLLTAVAAELPDD